MELREFAEKILFSDRLEDKLFHLSPEELSDRQAFTRLELPSKPGRPKKLSFQSSRHRASFPKQDELHDSTARGRILHFFANHELLALEIMALALLRFPEVPINFRKSIFHTMQEEQHHLRLYLERMNDLGVEFGDIPVNDFFWRCLSHMQDPIDYVAGMSLTFEQANLDFSLYYWQLMKDLGDEKTAHILKKVLNDEIGHVKFGLAWFEKWRPKKDSLFSEYRNMLTYPLSPSRAKGFIMSKESRIEAGIPQSFVDALEVYGGSRGRPSDVYWYNPDCEFELAKGGKTYQTSARKLQLISDQSTLLLFLTKPGDLILTNRLPSLDFLTRWKKRGIDLPQFIEFHENKRDFEKVKQEQILKSFQPWGWTRSTAKLCQQLQVQPRGHENATFIDWDDFDQSSLLDFFRKDRLSVRRKRVRWQIKHSDLYFGPEVLDGTLIHDLDHLSPLMNQMMKQFARPVVVKAAFGAAGQGMRRYFDLDGLVSQPQTKGWLQRQLDKGRALLVEPWFKKVADFSVVWGIDGFHEPTLTCFETDDAGRYLGHNLGRWQTNLNSDIKRAIFEEREGVSLSEVMIQVSRIIRSDLEDIGYFGPAGVDFPLYFWDEDGRYYIRSIGEINPRLTMGHVALALQKRLNLRDNFGIWRLFSSSDLRNRGFTSPQEAAREFESRANTLGLVDNFEWTCDHQMSKDSLSIVTIGSETINLLKQVFSFGDNRGHSYLDSAVKGVN